MAILKNTKMQNNPQIPNFGFIITRYVNSPKTNKYWNNNVKRLRNLYPLKQIIIIDDNSVQEYVIPEFDYKNVTVIQSEYPKRGELLPYIYFLKYKWFHNAVILHDSVFFHRRVAFETLIQYKIKAMSLWHFDKEIGLDSLQSELSKVLSPLKNKNKIVSNLLKIEKNYLLLKHKEKWTGCFGAQCFINLSFLEFLENKYNITEMHKTVETRLERMCLERIFGLLFSIENNGTITPSLFGTIVGYFKKSFGYTYEEYEDDLKHNRIPQNISIVKVWSGR